MPPSDDDVIGGDQLGSSDSGPWYPRTQRRFRTETPITVDKLVIILTEYVWEQNEAGDIRNTVARVLTEDGWVPFHAYEVLPIDSLPHITGLDMTRQLVVRKQISELERWIAAMIDFGNSESPSNEQDQGHDGEDDQDGPEHVVSHDLTVPPPVPDETTPEATPADNQQPERTVTDD